MNQNSTRSWYLDIILLTLLIGLVNYCFLGSAALFTPDEARYVEIPREMLMNQQFVVPHLNGIIYFEKPALYYWVVAGAIHLFGYGEWAVRSCPAILGLLGCLITYLFTRKLFNRRAGVIAALVLSSSLLYFGMSHLITMDMPLTFFLTASLYSFLIALQYPQGAKRYAWFCLAYACSGLAVMTKGLIGLAFPGMIVLIWIALLGRWALIKNMSLFTGILLILSINLPWLLLVQKQQPAFLHFYFIEQQFARYATPIAGREMSLLSYIGVFLIGLFPWITLLPQSIKHGLPKLWQQREVFSTQLYLLIWASFIFLFFACSHSILIPYLLPILPPLAIILAIYFDSIWQDALDRKQTISISCLFGLCLILGIGMLSLPHFQTLAHAKSTQTLLAVIAMVYFLGGAIAMWGAYRWPFQKIFISILLMSYLSLILVWVAAPYINTRSIKPLALEIKALLQQHPEASIVNFGNYHQDLPYYSQHLVIIVDWQNELSFGLTHQANAKDWLIDSTTFWPLWNSNTRLYVVMSQLDYARLLQSQHPHGYLLKQTLNDVLVTNKDPNT